MSRALWGFSWFGVALLFASCSSTPLHVVVDPELAVGETYEVSGHVNRYGHKPVRFGDFHTRKTRDGSTWSWTAGSEHLGLGVRARPYRFVFVGERGDEWQVECRGKTPILRHADSRGTTELDIGHTRLGCAMRDAADQVSGLSLTGNGFTFSGALMSGEERIEIRSLREVPNAQGTTTRLPAVVGFELQYQGRPVGAVDLLGRGRVYIAGGLPDRLRDEVALTSTVLLLFDQA